MIETEEPTPETADEPPFTDFDLDKMSMGDVRRFQRFIAGDTEEITQAWLDELLERVVIGGVDRLSPRQYGYIWNDLGTALRDALSPKVRTSARSLPVSDAEEL